MEKQKMNEAEQAARDAAWQWIPIFSEADLPKENGKSYMWQDRQGHGKRCIFTAPLTTSSRKYLANHCVAWRELPEPYTPQEKPEGYLEKLEKENADEN